MVYDGHKVQVAGREPDRDPVGQAQAQARWLEDRLHEITGKRYPIRPVVLYPGWYVAPPPELPKVWVLNPKALPTFLERGRRTLSSERARELSVYLKRFVRTQQQGLAI